MAACGSLQHIFDKPLDTPTPLFDPPIDRNSPPSFSETFLELHLKEKPSSTTTEFQPSPAAIPSKDYFSGKQTKHHLPSMSSLSLSMCTEGLGFESFVDVEGLKNEGNISDESKTRHERRQSFGTMMLSGVPKRCRSSGVEFPPPISSLGRSGKPLVCLKSYRDNGRFILKEVRIPTQDFLHACREDGRLKLKFIQNDDEAIDEEDQDDDDAAANDNNCLEVDHITPFIKCSPHEQ